MLYLHLNEARPLDYSTPHCMTKSYKHKIMQKIENNFIRQADESYYFSDLKLLTQAGSHISWRSWPLDRPKSSKTEKTFYFGETYNILFLLFLTSHQNPAISCYRVNHFLTSVSYTVGLSKIWNADFLDENLTKRWKSTYTLISVWKDMKI